MRLRFGLAVLVLIGMMSVVGCGKDTPSPTGMDDEEIKNCLVGKWPTSASYSYTGGTSSYTTVREYVAGGTYIAKTTNTSTPTGGSPTSNYQYEEGTWVVADGVLSAVRTKSGNSLDSEADAQSKATAVPDADQVKYAAGVGCKDNKYGTSVFTGGDTDNLTGTWTRYVEETYRKKDGAFAIASKDDETIILNEGGTGMYKEVDTDFYNYGTSSWYAEPKVTPEDDEAICKWSKTDTEFKVIGSNTATCTGSETDEDVSKYFIVGDALVLGYVERQ